MRDEFTELSFFYWLFDTFSVYLIDHIPDFSHWVVFVYLGTNDCRVFLSCLYNLTSSSSFNV